MSNFKKSPWSWVPTLYFAEGIPYVIVMSVSVLLYKRLGLSNDLIALYTSWLYLPWVIKPFWSPFVDMFSTKRLWVIAMQIIVGGALAGVAFTIPAGNYVQWTLAFFWIMAFASATHDIAADGFYMIGLDQHNQSLFVGVRSTFYRIATIVGQGLLVMLAGTFEVYKEPAQAWSLTFFIAAAIFLAIAAYHVVFIPKMAEDAPRRTAGVKQTVQTFFETFRSFFCKKNIIIALAFMLLYRLPEALLVKICPLFLVDKIEVGGLGLTTAQVGFVQGTLGVIGLLAGGILGGLCVAHGGFKRWLWPMVCAITIPDLVYIYLAYFQPTSMGVVATCIGLEQFGYGFGFTAYMLYLIYFSQGPNKTAHYAFCTGFMALSMMLPGMFAGQLQVSVGYLNFFIIACALIPLTFIAAALIKVDPEFGKKHVDEETEE